MSVSASEKDLRRWAEALAGVARTGIAFTDNQFERERYEEIMLIAGDIKAVADRGSRWRARPRWSRRGVDDGTRKQASPATSLRRSPWARRW